MRKRKVREIWKSFLEKEEENAAERSEEMLLADMEQLVEYEFYLSLVNELKNVLLEINCGNVSGIEAED